VWNSSGVDVLKLKRGMTMCRLYAFAAWLTGSTALALMALSLLLVPHNSVFADGPDVPSGCVGDACSVNCTGAGDCDRKACNADPNPANCGACGCRRVPDANNGFKCQCIFVQ
jgi:hypothetical protein